jgi:hypothetical protein
MFTADDVRLFIRAAVEQERHGCVPVDTYMDLQDLACCGDCAIDIINAGIEEAL